MANKIKIDNAVLKRLKRKEERERIEFKKKRKFILIVCEGGKTEPNYFKSIKVTLPINVLETVDIDIHGTGANTVKVVEIAEQKIEDAKRNRNKIFDSVWIVIDRDSFPANDFNNAIFKCIGKGYRCAWTNEAFELWYILHFQYRNTPMSREDYKRVIEEEINRRGNEIGMFIDSEFKYKKNDENIYKLLLQLGDENQAKENAKKLKALFTDEKFANHNPCTFVDELVEEIYSLREDECHE